MTVNHTTSEWRQLRAQIFVIYLSTGVIIAATASSSFLNNLLPAIFPNPSLDESFAFVAFPLLASALAEAGVYALSQQSPYFDPSPKQRGFIIGTAVSVLSLLAVWEQTRVWGGYLYLFIFATSSLYTGFHIEDTRWLRAGFIFFGVLFSLVLGLGLVI